MRFFLICALSFFFAFELRADTSFPPGTGKWPASDVQEARAHCAEVLKGLSLDYEALAPIGEPGGCGAPAPILITAVAGTRIEPPAEASCDFAEALHGWVTTALQQSAKTHLKRKVSVIENASAYVCRRRNNQSTGKLSEHAKANALDIARIRFDDGTSTNVKGDWAGVMALIGVSSKAAFLSDIRKFACIRFTTVLGPGSDPYHGDHFHVDLVRRKNGYRICQ